MRQSIGPTIAIAMIGMNGMSMRIALIAIGSWRSGASGATGNIVAYELRSRSRIGGGDTPTLTGVNAEAAERWD
jgi:hypothetical protein